MKRLVLGLGLAIALSWVLPAQGSIFITGSGGGADARIGTITNGKWCSASAGVIVCTEDAPAGAGDVTAVGNCVANDCFDGTAGQGTYLRFYDGNSHYTQIQAGDSVANLTFTFPTAYPAGASYLVNSTTGGVLGFTDPASFATAAHNHNSIYVALATYDAQTVLAATSDNTPAALTITEQTVLGRATGGNVAALAIDNDLASGVSDNDDTLVSAKGAKAYADLMVLKSVFDAHTILYAITDNTPAALTVTEQTVVGRAAGGNISALVIDGDLAGGASENDDTLVSAKGAKAYADLMVPKTIYDAYSVLYADADNTPAALTLAASQFVGRGSSGGVAALGLAAGGGLTISGTSLSVDIHGTTAETTVVDTMELLVWDVSAGALRRMTKGNLFYGVGGGSSPILDLADDGSNESAGLAEIATINDNAGTAAIFTNPSANKLLIDVSKNWPSASVALTGDSATSFFSTGAIEATRGGTGLTTVAVGSILAANSADTISAVTSASGLKVLQNNAGTISWATVTGTGSPVLATSPTFASDVTLSANTANITHSGTTALAIASTSGTVSVEGVTFNGAAISGASTLGMSGDLTLSANTANITHSGTTTLAIASTSGTVSIEGVTFNVADVSGLTSLSFGGDSADDGAIRLSNNTYIYSEASPAGTDISIIGVDAGEIIKIGASGASGVTITPATTFSGHLTMEGVTSTGAVGTGKIVFDTSPAFTTAILPASAGGATIGNTTYEWGHIYLTDSAIIYGQANQGNTLTSAATGWTANLEFSARSFIPTAAANASGEFGYSTNAFNWYANSENALLTATSNLWTFSSDSSATFAFTPSVLFTGGATYAAAATPSTNDGAALGSASLMWSDLFLASGGVINWNNGNATLTHSAGLLASNVPLSITGAVYPGTANTYALGSATNEWSDLFLGDGAVIYGQNDQSATLTSSAGKWTANVMDVTGAMTAGTISAGATGFAVDADGDTTVKSLTVTGATGTAGYARVLEDPAYGTNYRGWSMASATDYTTSWTVNWPGGDPTSNQFLLLGVPSGGVVTSTFGSFGSEFTVAANTVSLATDSISITKLDTSGTPTGSTALYGDGAWKAVTAAASGSDGYVQFAASSALSSDAGLAFNSTTQRLTIGKSGTTGGLNLLAETGTPDRVSTIRPSASMAADNDTIWFVSNLVAGDTVIASGNNQLGVVAKGTAYQIFGMNSGATAPAWTSTLGATGTRLTAGYFTDLAVTNTIAGSVTGNSGTVTIADAADDTTTWPLLGTSATGSLAPATDSSLTYNASTGALGASSFVPSTAADSAGEFGYATNAFSWFANSEDFTATASSNLWTFASGTSATFAFTPAVTITGALTANGGGTLGDGGDDIALNLNVNATDAHWSGTTITRTVKTGSAAELYGQAMFINSSGELEAADADVATMGALPAVCLLIDSGEGASKKCLINGTITETDWNWTVGGLIYVSTDPATTTGLTQTRPATSGNFIQRVGVALSADTILVMPSLDVGTAP